MLFLAIAAITGCLLCFAEPLDRALNPQLFERSSGGSALSPVEAIARLKQARPDLQVHNFPLHVEDGRTIPVEVAAEPGSPPLSYDQLFLDPGDGRVVGVREKEAGWDRPHLVEGLMQLHFNLLAGDWGRWLLGVVALAWLLSNFVGIYLTWPLRRPYWRQWRRLWRVSFKSSVPRTLLDLHRASGLWLLIGVTLLAFTSVAMNFYGEVYEPAVTRIAPLRYSLFDKPAPYPNGARPTLSYADALNLAGQQAEREGLSWQPATMLYRADWNLYGVTFTNDGTLNYRALGPVYLYFDAANGQLVHRVDPYVDSAGLVMIRMLYPLHSGQIAGWPTIALVFLLGFATLEMTVTGFYVWWKKRRSRVAGRRVTVRMTKAGAN